MIETERLILREYTSDDFDALYEIMSDAETMQHYPAPFDETRTRRWIEWNQENYARYGFGLWAVVLKETGELIGDCGITIQKIDGEDLPEIGYHIHKKYWRRGYAKEAALAVRDWAFENTDYPSLYSYCKYTNVASFKTAEAIGMHFEKEYADEVNKITHVSVIHRADTGKKAEYTQIQNELRKGISLCDSFEVSELKTAAGVDLAYWKTADGEYAVCCIVVIDMATHEVIEKRHFSGRIEVPYIPGFLAFRELPLVLKTAELLETKPDIYVFDGNGYLHPRHMGIATHASFYLDKPTFGVAKSYFRVDRQTDYVEPENEAGSYTDIIIDGEVYGRTLRTHKDVRPVFVSVGNHISLDTACHLAMILTDRESHIPVPTRLADLETHIERENARGKEGK